jgi:hypothetical protein
MSDEESAPLVWIAACSGARKPITSSEVPLGLLLLHGVYRFTRECRLLAISGHYNGRSRLPLMIQIGLPGSIWRPLPQARTILSDRDPIALEWSAFGGASNRERRLLRQYAYWRFWANAWKFGRKQDLRCKPLLCGFYPKNLI